MFNRKIAIAVIIFGFLVGQSFAVTLVNENFDDQDYFSPLMFYTGTGYDDAGIIYVSEDIDDSGFSLQHRHFSGTSGIGVLSGIQNYLSNGIYFRYWVKYPSTYLFPGDTGAFDNLKMLKIAGGDGDIEFIYKTSSGGGPSSLQLFWIGPDGAIIGNGTGIGSTTLGQTLSKDVWHKIEIYIKISSPSVVHVQVNDFDVYHDTNASMLMPASSYTVGQFISVRASNSSPPPTGHNEWYSDNITIVANEGDLCNYEPAEPSGIYGSAPAEDISPPGDASNFMAQPEDGQIALSWTNPTDSDFSGTMIRYTTGSSPYPATHTDGFLVSDRVGAPGSSDSFTVTGLENGIQYNFSAFTYDDAGNYSQTAHVSATPQVVGTGTETLAWSAMEQSGDLAWSDSGALWTPRVLVNGSSISAGVGNSIKIGFQGRASGDFVVKKISIAERDSNGAEGDVIDSTWTKILFDGNSLVNWASSEMVVPVGTEKFSDPVAFDFVPGKDYYVTFHLVSSAAYLITPVGYSEMYFDDASREVHAEDVDWSGNGHNTYNQRIHAISSIYIVNIDSEILGAPVDFMMEVPQ